MATGGTLIDINLLNYYHNKIQTELDLNIVSANTATIKVLDVTQSLTSDSGSFSKVSTSRLDVTGKLVVPTLDVTSGLSALTITATNLNGSYISASNELTAPLGSITEINSKDISVSNRLSATIGEFQTLKADHLDVDSLMTDYLRADGANITNAIIHKLFVDTGIFEEAIIANGTITGYLDAVHIRADSIVANKISLLGPDGLYYALNTEGVTGEGQTLENALDGSHIIAESITASKIKVTDLFAFQATIGGWHIDKTAIHSALKYAYDDNLPGVYLGSGVDEVETLLAEEHSTVLADSDGQELYFDGLVTSDSVEIGWRCEPDTNGFTSYLLYSKDGIEIMTPNLKVNRTTGAVTINGTVRIGPSSTLADGTDANQAISGAVSNASSAVSAVNDIQEAIENGDFDGEDATVLIIDSSAGNMFKNNMVSTVLTVIIYHGVTIIDNQLSLVDEYGSGAHLQWYYKGINDSSWHSIISSDSRLSANGFAFTLTPNDVSVKTVFKCELIT